jgi:hypothetical protein
MAQPRSGRIAALHTEDSVFHLHDIMDPWVGRDAIARKDSYIDWVSYQQQTGVDVSAGAAPQPDSVS